MCGGIRGVSDPITAGWITGLRGRGSCRAPFPYVLRVIPRGLRPIRDQFLSHREQNRGDGDPLGLLLEALGRQSADSSSRVVGGHAITHATNSPAMIPSQNARKSVHR